jgi:hypothetical protein
MSDRMLEILSGIVFVLVVFSLFLVLVGWLEPVLKFAKGVGEAIILLGGTGTSYMGMRFRSYTRSRSSLYDDDRW